MPQDTRPAGRIHVGLVPKYTHMGHWALYNERIAYAWLWALETGYFG